jgi:primosomal protein N' (replication factor Y)
MEMRQQSLFGSGLSGSAPTPWELDESDDRLVAEVVFAEPPFGPFAYLVPERLRGQLEAGCRAVVPLGRGNRRITGYCVRLHASEKNEFAASGRRLKEIHSLVDKRPLLSPAMLQLTEWMADYYLCPWGQALEAVIPSGVRGQAGTRKVTFLSVPTNVAARLTQLKLPPKQATALRKLIEAVAPMTLPQLSAAADCTAAPIRALQRKGLVQAEVRRVQQHDHSLPKTTSDVPPELNPDQQRAVETVMAALNAGRAETVLLYGVTGSGKTEVYIRAIEEVLSFGRQAIVLVPEISLTPQTVARFRSRFDRVAVLHSHLSAAERHWHWQQIAGGEISVVVGARSAVFAPTPQLGLIVLDEEHDASFKQDSAPRYHARDVALQRAEQERIPVVLGSATPSLESWHLASQGQFRLVELPERVMARPLPDVRIVDLRHEPRGGGAISRPLRQAMKEALDDGGQIILLLNRRGYSTFIQCPACGDALCCPECDIALTHHRDGDKMICHYCEYTSTPPSRCPGCQFDGIRFSGLGTQKLEAEIKARFGTDSCLRMDTDTMRRHGSHEEALDRFRSGEVPILLGTQMIAKGLDFPNVTLVGVVNADTSLHFPDYRSAERTFQLVTQVAGRAGRGPKGGRVLVQTLSPDHIAIQMAVRHDFKQFAQTEIGDRIVHQYPPATRMVRIILRGSDENAVEAAAAAMDTALAANLSPSSAVRVLGPAAAPIAKLRGRYRFHMLLVGPDSEPLRTAAKLATQEQKFSDDIQWAIDVDPWDML